ARVQSPLEACLAEEPPHRRSLVDIDRRPDLEHLAAPAGAEAGENRPLGHLLELRTCRLLIGCRPVVERKAEALALLGRPVDALGESLQPVRPALRLRIELETVLADITDAV